MYPQQTPRILIVEAEATILFTLEALLRHFGYCVTTATNGTEALALILRDSFDLLLINRSLPCACDVEIARGAQLHQPSAAARPQPCTCGDEIARRAQVHQPSAALLMLSGAPSLDERRSACDWLAKAGYPWEILSRVAAALCPGRVTSAPIA